MRLLLAVILFFTFNSLRETGAIPFSQNEQFEGSIKEYIERFLNAVHEYYIKGGIEAVLRGLQINEGEVFVPKILLFCHVDAILSEYDVACFRIPAVVQTDDGVLLAFAEARIKTCADCAELGIAMKRSLDGGNTWSNVTWPVPPTPTTDEGHEMARGGNPTVVYDTTRRQVVLHFNRGTTDTNGDGKYDCIPAVDNFQIISADNGDTWRSVKNISQFLGEYRGLLPGPGTGTYINSIDRMLFAGHYLTAERSGGAVVIYYSDDGGDNWSLSDSDAFPRVDESVVTAISSQKLIVNHRTDVGNCSITHCKDTLGCNCRSQAFSEDGGITWTEAEYAEELTDPICEGSLSKVSDYVIFSNPPMAYARANMSLAISLSEGKQWEYRIRVTDEFQYTDYSSLVNGALIRGVESYDYPVAGLVWGSCTHPIPMRVWCLIPTSWNIYFSKIELNPDTFIPT